MLSSQEQKLNCGTPMFISPEGISGENCDSRKADVWSIGVIFYILLHFKFPF